MAASSPPDDVCSLARNLAAQVEALCPHVPAGELAELTSRLALAECAHASGVSLADDEPDAAPAPLGNRIAWLPGSASAIVLPAGEETSGAGATATKVLEWTRRHATRVRGITGWGVNALRQIGSALASAYQAPPRIQ